MKAFLILGNQLYAPKKWLSTIPKKTIIFMREDIELCTHFKYHKHKIIFFLAAMRKYAEELKKAGYSVHYEALGSQEKTIKYDESLLSFIKKNKVTEIQTFEIEDKFFESRIQNLCQKNKILLSVLDAPMFLTTRSSFKEYLSKTKKPFMKTFYEGQRKRLNILVNKDQSPVGGQWSFDEDNRKALPKNYKPIDLPLYKMDKIDTEVCKLTEKLFSDHPGSVDNYWLPNDRAGALKWLNSFVENRLHDFGPYEDALSDDYEFINHSVLTPYLNTGLLTPDEVVDVVLKYSKEHKVPMASCEGFIRQVIGWREFIRGIYQNLSEKQDQTNFWKHKRKLNQLWYSGNTGIPPLDNVIRKTVRYGYAHHIERLMVVGSLMLLLEVEPSEAHRWFMEMFIDSSDWVMGPNVYGMAIFSDGGIFATKPYFCGSNYYRKMGTYKTGEWQDGVDGLYWSFIEKHKDFFLKNPRLSMMARTVEKMPADKKKRIFTAAEKLKNKLTTSR